MRKKGDEFEEMVAYLYHILSENDEYTSVEGPKVFLDSPEGRREFDVVVRVKAVSLNFLTVIECRDHKAPLDVKHIDGFSSKVIDVKANKGVIVSRNGFTRKAINKAQRLGISTFTFKSVHDDPKLASKCARIPVFIGKISEFNFTSHFRVTQLKHIGPISNSNADKVFSRLNDPIEREALWRGAYSAFYGDIPNFEELLRKAIVKRDVMINNSGSLQTINLEPSRDGPFILTTEIPGLAIEVAEPQIRLTLEDVECYFGDLTLSSDHYQYFEHVDVDTLSHVQTVLDPTKLNRPLHEFLDPVDGEPEEIPTGGFVRLTLLQIDSFKKIDFGKSLGPLPDTLEDYNDYIKSAIDRVRLR